MSDLIERQAAIDAVKFGITYAKAFNKSTGEVKELFKEGNKALNEAVERLKELPSAQPQRTGRWIRIDESIKVSNYKCSECGRTIWDDRGYDPYVDYPYCHCGARMEGE